MRRRDTPGKRTIPAKPLTAAEREEGARYSHTPAVPESRAQCPVSRPCTNLSCRYHLAVDISTRGGVVINFPHLSALECPESCALDMAERGEHTLEEIGDVMNMSRERVRQIEVRAMRKLKPLLRRHGQELTV